MRARSSGLIGDSHTWSALRNFVAPSNLMRDVPSQELCMLYRAYLLENGHTYVAIDLTCVDDGDAKRQAAALGNGRDIELWQGDRRIALLRSRRQVLAETFSAGVRR
jgi:hypothetical protein